VFVLLTINILTVKYESLLQLQRFLGQFDKERVEVVGNRQPFPKPSGENN